MREVEYKGKNGPEKHRIYEPDEVDFEYQASWRLGQTGDWVLTDDDKVVEVLASGHLKDGSRWLRTCTRTISCLKKCSLTTEPQENRYTFNGKAPQGLHTGVTPRVEAFARLVARGLSEGKIDAPAAYQAVNPRSSRRNAEHRSSVLLKRKEVRDIIDSELGELLEQVGCTKRWLMEQFMELAMDAENANARLGALKELSGFHGLHAKKTTEGTLKFRGIPLANIEAAVSAISASEADYRIPSETTGVDALKLLPSDQEVDLDSIEASIEVTIEEADLDQDDS